MKFKVDTTYGYLNIIAENKQENVEVARVRRELSEIWGGKNYKLVPIECTCPKGEHTLSHLEFVAVNEEGKQRADLFHIAGRIKR